MIYRIHTPSPPLHLFIEHFYYCEGYLPPFTRQKVLPDGAIELFIDLTDEPKKLYTDESCTSFKEYSKSWIAGERTKYIVVQAGSLKMAGIRFRPGGTAPFFSFPASAINDEVLGLDLVWGSGIHSLRGQLAEASSPEELFLCFEQFMARKASSLEPQSLVGYALHQLQQSPEYWDIKSLSGKIGISNKHLITLFSRYVGLSPKMFARICKFQKVLRLIETQGKVEWAPVAYECGYADQAHFIKEFRAFSGLNPTNYLTQKGEYMNSIPLP